MKPQQGRIRRGQHAKAVITIEASDETAMTAMLKVGSLGNVRTTTLRAFSVDDMKKFIGRMPK